MMAGRLSALRPLLDLGLRLDQFEPEAGQTDGTLAHALERWIGVVIQQQGLSCGTQGNASRHPGIRPSLGRASAGVSGANRACGGPPLSGVRRF